MNVLQRQRLEDTSRQLIRGFDVDREAGRWRVASFSIFETASGKEPAGSFKMPCLCSYPYSRMWISPRLYAKKNPSKRRKEHRSDLNAGSMMRVQVTSELARALKLDGRGLSSQRIRDNLQSLQKVQFQDANALHALTLSRKCRLN